MTEQRLTTAPGGSMTSNGPRPLPYSAYPKARDLAWQGVQPLPESLLPLDFARAQPYRSSRYSTVVATELTPEQLLQMAWVIAASFAAANRRPGTSGRRSIHPRGSWRRATPIRSEPTRSMRETRRRSRTG
jgi:catalase (peroxidase I)